MKAVRIGTTLYAWDERLDATARALKKSRDSVSRAINLVGFVAALGSVGLLAYATLIAESIDRVFTAAYWLTPSLGGFFLCTTFLIGAFLFYRLTQAAYGMASMPKRVMGGAQLEEIDTMRGVTNMAQLFQADALKSLGQAQELAEKYQHASVDPLHLLIGSLSSDDVSVVFGRLGIPFARIKEPVARKLQSLTTGTPSVLSSQSEETLLAAFMNAYEQGRAAVSPLEVFFEAYKRDPFLQELFYDLNVDEQRLANVVAWIRITGKLRERYEQFRRAAFFKPTGAMNRSMTSVATPHLDAYSEDLTAHAVNGYLPMLIGRESEMEELLRVIEGGRQSVVLVGPEGVGKDALLSGVAERMVEETVPELLQDKRLVSLSIPSLISGATPAQAQERLMAALVDAARARNVVLVIPNIEQMTGYTPGGSQTSDLAALLTDALSRGFTFAIATTSPQAYASVVERSVLGRVFEKVNVPEPDTDTAIQILESKIGQIEHEMEVVFSYEAVERAVELSDRYMHEAYLPKKAIEICREVALYAAKARGKGALVSGEDVSTIVAQKTGIPVTAVAEEEKDKLLHLEERMHGRVIGQDEAVKAVSSALRRARAELRADNRPIANFLFLGPTGVGKTELAKTVAETYFGSEEAMLRFDMSEYQDAASISRLIGNSSNQAGLLTEAVRRKPFSIVLLDEFEKAHPEILNLFLQVFDDGRLTDAAGRTIDFTNAIIVATSNAGTQYIQDAVAAGTPMEEIKTRLLEEELRGTYRPELLNRFDGVIVFKPLTREDVAKIAQLMVASIGQRLEPKGIHFRATDEAVADLAKKGYDPKFGARPLRRVVQEEVDNAIANALLEGKVRRRDTIVLNPGGVIEIEQGEVL